MNMKDQMITALFLTLAVMLGHILAEWFEEILELITK